MKKILITGGACAGKTTSLNLIKDYFEKNNYKVYVMEEVPTKLIYDGITSDKIGRMEFQELVIKTGLENEEECNKKYINQDNVVVIFDGSPLDSLKFITKEELDEILEKYNTNIDKVFSNYDEVLFLDTIAKKYPELYSNDNNKARMTDPKAAVERNDKLLNEYLKIGKINVIENDTNYDNKNKKIIDIISK